MKWSGSIKEQQMEILKYSTSTQVQYLSKCEEANAPPLQLMVEWGRDFWLDSSESKQNLTVTQVCSFDHQDTKPL